MIYQTWIDQFNRSFKRGAAWQEPTAFTDVGGGWGTIEVDAAGDALIVGENGQDGISLYRSADAREEDVIEPTFVETTVLDEGVWTFGSCRPNRAGAVSQIEIALDRSNGPRQGNIYVLAAVQHWRVFGGTDWSSLVLLRSSDGGTTWSEPVRINDDDPSGDDDWRWLGTFDVAPNGRIDVVWNDTRNNPDRFARFSETYYAFSTDGGATFSDNVPIGPEWNSHIGWPQQEKIGDYYDLVSDDVGAHLVYATTYNGEQDVYYLRIGDYDCNANGVGDAIDITNGDARDCNANGIPDSCEIATGAEIDDDGNGVPDRCECAADLDRDLDIDSDDFFIYLDLFAADDAAADLDGDGDIDGDDFAHFIDGFEAGCP